MFFDEPVTEYSVREFARLRKISPSTASSYLQNMKKQELLVKRKERNLVLYKANTEAAQYKDAKKYANIKRIRESRVLEEIEKRIHPLTVFLFGSYAKGENQKESDIDLFILTHNKTTLDLSHFQKILKANIQVFLFTPKEMPTLKEKNPNLLNNIINGTRLTGFWEVFECSSLS